MLRSVNSLGGYVVEATDGEIGYVEEFLFDDDNWTIRYMVVDTGNWLSSRKVLISPSALGNPNWKTKTFHVVLTKEQVKNSPRIDTQKPVSRQQEAELHTYYDWPTYWTPRGLATPGYLHTTRSQTSMPASLEQELTTVDQQPYASSLRSTDEVSGYRIQATDGEIGHVEDFVVNDTSWIIRYLVIDTRNWLPGRQVLVAPNWIEKVRWNDKKVQVNMSKENIKRSPKFDPSAPINRNYEVRLYDFYGRPHYWD